MNETTATTTKNFDQNTEINKVHQLLAKNIDDFKYLVLCNMRLKENSNPSSDILHLDVNRISDLQQIPTENLEAWVNKEGAPKSAKKEEPPQKVKSKNRRTVIDMVEQWLMNEAKKDLFAEMDAKYGGPQELSSDNIRELGQNLISLADKLDKMK